MPSYRSNVRILTLLAALLVLALTAACSGDDKPAATASPTPTANPFAAALGSVGFATATVSSPAGPPCPIADATLCAFAAQLESLLLTSAYARIPDLSLSREITCKAPSNAGPDPDANICKGLAPGTKVNGYDIGGRASEGSSVNKEGLATFFQGISASSKADAADDYGKGGWRLFTVAEGTQGRHSIVFSYISQSGPRLFRNALVVDAVKDGANWKGRSYVSGLIFPQEMPALLAGGDQANSKYSPWNPAGITLPAAPGFYFSATVAIKGGGADCVNVRTTPSKTGPVGECVKDGAQYSIIGGPTDADGLKWWNTQKLGSQQTTGWIAADFLAIQKQ